MKSKIFFLKQSKEPDRGAEEGNRYTKQRKE